MQNNVSKLVSIALAIVASFFFITTTVFAMLYGMERHSKNFNQTQQGMYCGILFEENDQTEILIVNSYCNKQQ
jgi:hypothetical protein